MSEPARDDVLRALREAFIQCDIVGAGLAAEAAEVALSALAARGLDPVERGAEIARLCAALAAAQGEG